jgi:N-acetylmuramoyl-L-alanine amidase
MKYRYKVISFCLAFFMISFFNVPIVKADQTNATSSLTKGQYMDINSPINGYETGDSFHITGWAVNKNGVSKVKVYVDNNFVGDAYYGAPTDGLKTSYPDYVGSDRAGYDFLIDSIKYGSGNHVLKVEVTGNDGVITNQSINIKLTKSKPAMDINSPSNGTTMNNGFHITGWAVNKSGVKEVRIYSNNNYIGQAYYGASTTGLLNTFGDYSGAGNAGYDYYVDTNKFANGSNNLTVEAIGNDGQITRQTINVALSKSYPAMDISSPQGEITTDKSVHITGWAVNKNGVKKINVYDNGNYVGQAYYGASTPSLNNTFGGYSNAGNAGFDYNVDINSFLSGKHEFKIEAEGIDGNKISQSTIINIIKKSPMMDISSPNNGQTINGETHITGWAIAPSGIKNITVYLNSTNVGNAYYGAPTPALQSSYGDYSGSANGGYDFYLDSKKYYNGDYTLKIEATANSGEKVSLTRSVKLSNVPIMDVNSPTNNMNVSKTIGITGWALSGVGISKVTINVDDKYVGQASLGISTPGLASKSEYPNNQYAGYYMALDTKQYSNDIHKVTVITQANDGSYTYMDRVININNVTKVIVVDPGHNFGGDDGAYSNDGKYIERELNMQVAVKLQADLQNMGYKVVMTRQPWERSTDDLKTSLQKRVDLANDLKADLFISLHHNSSDTSSVTGVSTYYSTYKPGIKNVQQDLIPLTSGYDGYTDTKPTDQGIKSRELAKNVENSLASRCNYKMSGVDSGRVGFIDRNLKVTVDTNMPSILVELGYISNSAEAARCSNANEQQNKANVIASEIQKMF